MTTHYDLVIIGTGSGNSVPDEDLADWSIAVVEPDVFGGTCLNRGCIPSKMFVYAADVARTVAHAGRYGIDATLDGANWPAIRDRLSDTAFLPGPDRIFAALQATSPRDVRVVVAHRGAALDQQLHQLERRTLPRVVYVAFVSHP